MIMRKFTFLISIMLWFDLTWQIIVSNFVVFLQNFFTINFPSLHSLDMMILLQNVLNKQIPSTFLTPDSVSLKSVMSKSNFKPLYAVWRIIQASLYTLGWIYQYFMDHKYTTVNRWNMKITTVGPGIFSPFTLVQNLTVF